MKTFLNDYKKLGSVCSGGRYENLAEYYTDKKLPWSWHINWSFKIFLPNR